MPAPSTGAARSAALDAIDRLAAERGLVLVADAPLGPLTTLRVGGPADRMLTATTTDELLAGLLLARDAGLPVGVLGKGSDLVVADGGVRGLVVRNRADRIEVDGTSVTAEGGASMAALVKRCTAAGLAGLEFGISIPGSLGGAIWANAGAHGGEIATRASRPVARSCSAPRSACGRATPTRSAPGSPRTRPSDAPRSRWPTRTRGACSATRPGTTPGG